MTGRHWLRRDVLLPIFYLLVFGAGLYWLSRQLNELPAASESTIVAWLVRIMFGIYLLLVLITVRHVLSTYDLERYDPGNKASLKRLMRRRRYKLSKRPIPLEGLLVAFEQQLHNMGYVLETESRVIGRVFSKTFPPVWMLEQRIDRVMVVQHDPLNVIMVDQVLQDCIRYVMSQVEKPSQRNQLILVTRMMNTAEAASAAAGVVNFLGKFKDGTLGVMLLAVCQHRLFYPADRTLQPRLHRWFQDALHLRFLTLIRQMQRSNVRPDPASLEGHTRRLGEHAPGPLFNRIAHDPAGAEIEEPAEHLTNEVDQVQRQDLPFDQLSDSVEPVQRQDLPFEQLSDSVEPVQRQDLPFDQLSDSVEPVQRQDLLFDQLSDSVEPVQRQDLPFDQLADSAEPVQRLDLLTIRSIDAVDQVRRRDLPSDWQAGAVDPEDATESEREQP